MSGVTVTLGNGNIGSTVAGSDNTVGLVVTGATEGTITAGTPFLVTNEASITALGITTGTNPTLVKLLAEVVAETKARGVNTFALYILPLASSVTVDEMADVSVAANAVRLVNYANGKIKILAVLGLNASPTVTAGIDADCYTAITKLQALCVSYAALPKNWPMRGVVGITHFTGTAADLTDITANATNRVMAVIGDTVSGTGSALGVVLGRLMSIPVQRKISRVLDGPVSNTTAFINTTSAELYASTSTIETKGFVTFKQITGYNGFFFTSDQTACPTTDDYHFMCRGRVIDKAHSIVVATYNEQIDNEVDTNEDGTIDPGSAKQLQTSVERNLNNAMTAARNITRATADVSTSQNVDATNTVAIGVSVKGKGYSTTFDVTLGFEPVA